MYTYMYMHVNGSAFFGKRDNIQNLFVGTYSCFHVCVSNFVDISVFLYM